MKPSYYHCCCCCCCLKPLHCNRGTHWFLSHRCMVVLVFRTTKVLSFAALVKRIFTLSFNKMLGLVLQIYSFQRWDLKLRAYLLFWSIIIIVQKLIPGILLIWTSQLVFIPTIDQLIIEQCSNSSSWMGNKVVCRQTRNGHNVGADVEIKLGRRKWVINASCLTYLVGWFEGS